MLDHSAQVNRSRLREHRNDQYDTPPEAVRALLKVERLPQIIWEPACGRGNIVMALRAAGHQVFATDLNYRGCPDSHHRVDFLFPVRMEGRAIGAIVTNPPFQLASDFVEMAIERAPLVIMLLRLGFYESEGRSRILEGAGLARIHQFRKRLPMMHREGWTGKRASSSMAFAWYVWIKYYTGPTIIDRISWEK